MSSEIEADLSEKRLVREAEIGLDPLAEGFCWLAGQGGYGIQTAPAAALLGHALLTRSPVPEAVANIDAAAYGPGRFR